MANPVPEIFPDEALAAGAILSELVVVTFRIKLIMLAFPGIFRGALDARAKRLRLKCKLPLPKVLQN